MEQQTWDDLNVLFKEINKKKDGYIDFNEFRDHMMELIKKGRYERRNRADSIEFASEQGDQTLPEVVVEKTSTVNNEDTKEAKDIMIEVLNPPDFVYKTIVVGDIAVGKSCLLHRAVKGEFSKKCPTIGTDRVKINTILPD